MKYCINCNEPLPSGLHHSRKNCDRCWTRVSRGLSLRLPGGRSYVGSSVDIRTRNRHGIARSNPWLIEAFKAHPPATWRFEVLEEFPLGSQYAASSRTIERLKTWDREHGYNFFPAVWKGDAPGVSAGRDRHHRRAAALEAAR